MEEVDVWSTAYEVYKTTETNYAANLAAIFLRHIITINAKGKINIYNIALIKWEKAIEIYSYRFIRHVNAYNIIMIRLKSILSS